MKKGIATKKTSKAKEFGYDEKRAKDIGKARARFHDSKTPVAKDTNKTRRPRVLPLKKGK